MIIIQEVLTRVRICVQTEKNVGVLLYEQGYKIVKVLLYVIGQYNLLLKAMLALLHHSQAEDMSINKKACLNSSKNTDEKSTSLTFNE